MHSKIISDGELHLIQNEHMQLNSQLELNRLQFKCQFNVKQKANIIAYFYRKSSYDNDSIHLKIICFHMNFFVVQQTEEAIVKTFKSLVTATKQCRESRDS